MPSGALQSPFSWIWKPCSLPGFRPVIWPVTWTLPSTSLKVTLPLAPLPWVGASSAVADASAAGAEGAAGSVVAPSAGAAGGVSACGAAGCWPQAARPSAAMAANSEVWIRRMQSLPG
ncbi:hypothetical protein G6F24_014000 [Rhizopus arrhizus]|nr:hypothetical protein G6F24_014000 [Rhizopus arrhizus]